MSKVELIASTVLTDAAYDVLPLQDLDVDPVESDADYLAELAGRECYQAWSRSNPDTNTNETYLGTNIIGKGHTSVFVHPSFTFRFTDVSRSLTHELIRARFLGFSELSQRYVDMDEVRFVCPPALRKVMEQNFPDMTPEELDAEWQDQPFFQDVRQAYAELVEGLETQTDPVLTRKQIREAARCVLPNCTETRIEVSGNVRAWRDFLNQRLSKHADAEIREVAEKVRDILLTEAPNSFQDFAPGLLFSDIIQQPDVADDQLALPLGEVA